MRRARQLEETETDRQNHIYWLDEAERAIETLISLGVRPSKSREEFAKTRAASLAVAPRRREERERAEQEAARRRAEERQRARLKALDQWQAQAEELERQIKRLEATLDEDPYTRRGPEADAFLAKLEGWFPDCRRAAAVLSGSFELISGDLPNADRVRVEELLSSWPISRARKILDQVADRRREVEETRLRREADKEAKIERGFDPEYEPGSNWRYGAFECPCCEDEPTDLVGLRGKGSMAEEIFVCGSCWQDAMDGDVKTWAWYWDVCQSEY